MKSTGYTEILGAAGWSGVFAIFITLGCVWMAWLVLQELNWDKLVRNAKSSRTKCLQLVLAIVIGYLLAKFILDYWNWVGMIKWIVDG